MAIERPLNIDEQEFFFSLPIIRGSDFFSFEFAKGFPILASHLSHTVMSLSSYLSIHWLGVTPTALRLPCIFFVVIFLIAVSGVCCRHGSSFSGFFISSHLLANSFLQYYLSSSRGYVSMIAFNGMVYWLVLEGLKKENPGKLFQASLGIAILGSIFSHPFGAVFCFLILLTVLFWLNTRLERPAPRALWHTALIILLSLPLISFVLYRHYQILATLLDLHVKGMVYELGGAISNCFGLENSPVISLLLAMAFGASMLLWLKRKRLYCFESLFLMVSGGFLFLTLQLLQPKIVMGRFLVGFLIPVLLFIGEAVHGISHRLLKCSLGGSFFILFVGVPLYRTVPAELFYPRDDFHLFIERVRDITHYNERDCFSFSGVSLGVKLSEFTYFARTRRPWQYPICDRYYHLILKNSGPTPFRAREACQGESQRHCRLLYSDKNGNILYELTNRSIQKWVG